MMSTHKSIRNSENAVHETQNHHLVGTYRLGEKYINILNEKSYIATISLPKLYRRAVFALQNPPFCTVKQALLHGKTVGFGVQDNFLHFQLEQSLQNKRNVPASPNLLVCRLKTRGRQLVSGV